MRSIAFIVLLLAGFQDRKPPPAVAIAGARIHTGTEVIERGTLVMRGGRIIAVGADVLTPADAEVIDGKGLQVYPGFIDSLTPSGLGDTKRTPDERKKAESTPHDFAKDALGAMESANRKGIRSELAAADLFTISEELLEKIHRGGFAAVHIGLREEYLGGTGALVMLNGGTRRESIVKIQTGQVGSFASYGDGYPSTSMGVMAHLRQVMHDARRLRDQHARFEKEPQTATRPPADPALEALWPILDRKIPLFMEANTLTEMERALLFAEEFKLNLVITGGLEAGLMAARLKKAGVFVILGLKFPKEIQRPKKPAPPKPDEEDRYEETPKPKKLYDEEKREWEQKIRAAIALHEASVPFSFATSTLKEPSEALRNIGTLVGKGLPAEAALKAVTAAPAGLFGVSSTMGTIAPGRAAHVTVLSAPLGDKEAKVRFVFADGFKFAYKAEGKSEPPEIEMTGVWKFAIEKSDLGALEFTLSLKQAGRELSGTARSPTLGESVLAAGSVSGKSFRFTLRAKIEGDDAEIEFRGEMKDGALKGSASGAAGDDLKWSAKKPE